MAIVTGEAIVASDIENAINSVLPEYASTIIAGGLQGKDFVASSQADEYVVGTIAALCPTYQSGISAHQILIDDMDGGDYVFVSDVLTSSGIIAGNSVRAPFYIYSVQVSLQSSAANAIAHCDLLNADKLTDLQITNPTMLFYGSIARSYFSASVAAAFHGAGYSAASLAVYGLP